MRFHPFPGAPQRASAGLTEAPDGALVAVGVGGARRILLETVQK
jgi:hypothetical protein